MLRVVAHLHDLERRTGRRVKLALEPEPACYLETTDETVAYFPTTSTRAGVSELAGSADPDGRGHQLSAATSGIVFDIGHQSVGFEDIPRRSPSWWRPASRSSSCRRPRPYGSRTSATDVPELRVFTDTIYLSQTTQRRDGG